MCSPRTRPKQGKGGDDLFGRLVRFGLFCSILHGIDQSIVVDRSQYYQSFEERGRCWLYTAHCVLPKGIMADGMTLLRAVRSSLKVACN